MAEKIATAPVSGYRGLLRCVSVWLLVVAAGARLLAAEPGGENPLQASSSEETRQRAIRSIPFEMLDEQGRAKVNSVLANVSLFRRMPVRVIDCDPDLYLFLVRHPDVVTNIWQVMGLSRLDARQAAPNLFRLSDNAGTRGLAEFLCQGHDVHVAYVEGWYQGPLSPRPARGRCLLVLRNGYLREVDGRYYITARLDAFVNVESGAAELLTKVFSTLLAKVADGNFTQTLAFVASLSHHAEMNAPSVQRLSRKLEKVRPEDRQQLSLLAERISRRAEGEPPASFAHHDAQPAEIRRRSEPSED